MKSNRRLTEGEQKCADGFESVGVTYHVIESVEQALEMISND